MIAGVVIYGCDGTFKSIDGLVRFGHGLDAHNLTYLKGVRIFGVTYLYNLGV